MDLYGFYDGYKGSAWKFKLVTPKKLTLRPEPPRASSKSDL